MRLVVRFMRGSPCMLLYEKGLEPLIPALFPVSVKQLKTFYFNTEACIGNRYGLQENMAGFDRSSIQYVYDSEDPARFHAVNCYSIRKLKGYASCNRNVGA
jgi:hypothetical protein